MKNFIAILMCINLSSYASEPFQFISYKDENGFLTPSFLSSLAEVFHPHVFFETGTYLGQTTEHAAPFFKEIHTVELFDPLYQKAKNKLARFSNITVYQGESPGVITQLAPQLEGTILFWLDAHYSGEGTGRGSNDRDPNAFTAIREELAAIKSSGIKNCIILIDDIRGFGSRIEGRDYLGCWAYPTVQEVLEQLNEINNSFGYALVGDILFAYDPAVYQPEFSETVMACTQTRFYDGYNLTDEELIKYEQMIMRAPIDEKNGIIRLCKMVMDYKDPLFWHDLAFGLVELGLGNNDLAEQAFNKVKKIVNTGSASFTYNHWRLDMYLQKCN